MRRYKTPRRIAPQSINISDYIEVQWADNGVIRTATAYVGKITDSTLYGTRVYSANGEQLLIRWDGIHIIYPDPSAIVFVHRAAPEKFEAMF